MALTFEQIEDLDETNFELALDERSPQREARKFVFVIGGEIPEKRVPVERLERVVADSLLEILNGGFALDPYGLRELILSCRGVSKEPIEPFRDTIVQNCPKPGLVHWLYRQARAPPQQHPFSSLQFKPVSSPHHLKSPFKTTTKHVWQIPQSTAGMIGLFLP